MKKDKVITSLIHISTSAFLVCFLAACGNTKLEISDAETEDKVTTEAVTADEKDYSDKVSYEYAPGADYELIWSDEFEGTSLDTNKWSYQLGDGADYGIVGWGNGESQFYTDNEKNVNVSDGTLKITALKGELPNGATGFTSGRIRTLTDDDEALFSTTFGRVEAKIRIEGGSGIWPAFWMLPADSTIYGKWAASGEIDIMEVRGRLPKESTGTAHFGRQWPSNIYKGGSYTFTGDTDVSDYHVYAVEWEPEEIRWYIDDVNFFTLKNWYSGSGNNATDYTHPAPFDVPFYILLNVAVGGNFDPDAILKDESFPGIMTVDYVRVYQKKDGYLEALLQANEDGKALEDGPKEPLKSKDSIYNGSFNQGINHVGYWKMEGIDASVDPYDLARRLKVSGVNGESTEEVKRLYQTGLYMDAASTYGVRVDTSSSEATYITIRITDDNGIIVSEEHIEVNPGENSIIAYKINNEHLCVNATFEILFENESELYVDNIMLKKLS